MPTKIIREPAHIESLAKILAGRKRVQDVVDRPPLFLPAPPKPTQDAMDL